MSLEIAEMKQAEAEEKTEQRDEDARLVRESQNGNVEAFGELCKRYTNKVFAIAIGITRNRTFAIELQQDVFAQALRKIDYLDDPRKFEGWVGTIAKRTALNFKRKQKKTSEVSTDSSYMYEGVSSEFDPANIVVLEETQQQVRDAIQQLPDIYRTIVISFYYQQMSLKEIVRAYTIPEGTVKRRLHTARNRLKTIICEETDIIDNPRSEPHPNGHTHVA